jgi:hypothetical protein
VPLDQDIQDVPVLIYCPPQIVMLALDCQKYLVEMSLVAGLGTAAMELIGIVLAKLTAPLANRLVGDGDSTFQEYLFDVAKAQAEPKIQPHRMADDLDRKAVILIGCRNRRCVHAETLTYGVELNKLTMPL